MLAVGVAGLALYGIDRSQHYLARSHLAHQVLDGYLRVAERGQRLLSLPRVEAVGVPGAALRTQIKAELRRIDRLVAAELALVGPSEKGREERERLALIEREFAAAIAAGASRPIDQQGGPARRWYANIDTAIAAETREVAGVTRAAGQLADRLRLLLLFGALSAAGLVGLALTVLLRDLDAPLARLMAGADALAAGDLGHRIGLTGDAELPRLSQRFDRMAAELERQRLALAEASDGLEREVVARTAELSAANERLALLDANRRRLLADISHELRTPLTVVRGEAEVTLRASGSAAGEYRAALERVLEQAQHMGRLVDDLLFVARQDAGELRLKRQPVDLRELVARACADIDVLARAAGGGVRCTLPEQPVPLAADADRMRQLLFILLDNALRYAVAAPDITVTLLAAPPAAQLEVRDRGLGIPAADLPFVFERFQRAANAADHDPHGSGLGLFMARAIVAAHGGAIDIDSSEGAGTTVTVDLPVAEPLRIAS